MAIEIDRTKTALTLLHFQKDICDPGGAMAPSDPEALARFEATITNTETVSIAARKAKIPIIYSAFGRPADGQLANRFGSLFRWIVESNGCVEGQPGYEFTEKLMTKHGDIVTRGPGISAFAGSTFGQELAFFGVRSLLVAGITTHWAVEGTVRDAADRGFDCVVLTDCVASASVSTHEAALERMTSIARLATSTELVASL